ncbi:MAG TPA: carbamoyl-phosphate synthase large subunit [Anaerolineales bacterium]|nr:carbamoyl-phosphate synthase large subunit [Anaerolineales bacterium]
MPKRTDIHSILIIGSGPIVIGQASEFDYSGVQACKVLRREDYRVALVNSNPATIMTDPEFADATYIEPLTVDVVEKIIAIEKPDAILPTVGGQTGLNLAMDLWRAGVLDRHGVQLIGARPEVIDLAEDRLKFRDAMLAAGLSVPRSGLARTLAEAEALAAEIGLPVLIRPSFTLGGSGAGIVQTLDEFRRKVEHGLRESPVHEVLIEQSVLGWKEYELEVMRDRVDNFVVVCSIENLDPMGVHTGDSITIAPAQTLTDREYQRLRDMARTVMATVGVETGGSNVQFAVNPADGEALIIEMNPRVSRSSALASKATGFPIAKIAALLAVGYTLDEIPNDITRVTPASFEPSIDYCVVKVPRFAFEKFAGSEDTLGPQMKSVGEVMSIGRTFPEALNKALRGLELGRRGAESAVPGAGSGESALRRPTALRIFEALDALRAGLSEGELVAQTAYDPWFVAQMGLIVGLERQLAQHALQTLPDELLRAAKRLGFADSRIADLLRSGAPSDLPEPRPVPHASRSTSNEDVRQHRLTRGIAPNFYRVDTCAAEFEAFTPYLYSTYERDDESAPSDRRKVVILGGGPNRIGQGIEFDYCCVHACYALKDLGFETIMVNCNPETVSTDYDTADRLYFEPLTLEDVRNILDNEKPEGVIVQFGGQTPINLARGLAEAGAPIWGTAPERIDLAEDRVRFGQLLRDLDIPHPEWGTARSLESARTVAARIGYPVLVRPSYVLGGRAMDIAFDDRQLADFLAAATAAAPDGPVLIDRYLEDAYEVDVDALCDSERVVIAGVMQHIEEAGVHSGDSACVLPPWKISNYHLQIIEDYTERLGRALQVRGLMNIQYAIKDDEVYVFEVNPRASRTVPFVSKATGVPLAKLAAQVMAGKTLAELGFTQTPQVDGFFVKEVVLPFKKFPGADYRLGPEMRSTGEVMGHAARFGHAFAKAELAAGTPLPMNGNVLITVNDFDKGAALKLARDFHRLGFGLLATPGTAAMIARAGLPVRTIQRFSEGSPNAVELIEAGEVQLIVNTPLGAGSAADMQAMRSAAVLHAVTLLTTLSAATAAVTGIQALAARELQVRSLQMHHAHQA